MYTNKMFTGPAFFELGWDQRNKALKLRILKDVFKSVEFQKELVEGAAGKQRRLEEENVGRLDFVEPNGKKWGFGGVLAPSRSEIVHPSYLEWKIPIPKAIKKAKRMGIDVRSMYNICSTLSLVSSLFSYRQFEREVGRDLPPKLMIFTYVGIGSSGKHGDFYFGPTICKAMFPWLRSFRGVPTMINQSVKAMETSADIIHGEKINWGMASVVEENGGIFICSYRDYQSSLRAHYSKYDGLDTPDWMREAGKEITAFDLDCHNVDTVDQQLLLFVGLAAICDQARRFNIQNSE